MTILSPTRDGHPVAVPATKDGQPVLHVQINDELTQQDFRALCTKINQAYIDKQHKITESPELGEDE